MPARARADLEAVVEPRLAARQGDLDAIRRRRSSPAARARSERWAAAEAITRADIILYRNPYRREVVGVRDAVVATIFDAALEESPLALAAGQREVAGYLFADPVGDHLVARAIAAYRDPTYSSVTLARDAIGRDEPCGAFHLHPDDSRDPSDADLVGAARGACRGADGRWLELICSISHVGPPLAVSGYRARPRRAASGPSWAVEPVTVEVVG